jgi:hypothetical protein
MTSVMFLLKTLRFLLLKKFFLKKLAFIFTLLHVFLKLLQVSLVKCLIITLLVVVVV